MGTPLLDALRARAEQKTARFHMPGHKGRDVTGATPGAAADFTELDGTGDLYAGGDVIARAEALWAEVWGAPLCQFLTCGATQGIHAALLLEARRGRHILVDRASHRSVYTGMGMWGLSPTYLPRRQDRPLAPEAVERGLREHPEVKTVCITSPTYYGVLSDVAGIARVCHEHGARLVVDAAHGAHLPFLMENPCREADLAVCSPHKTLPVYGQGALLFARGVDEGELRAAAATAGTSSPSYLVMGALDGARDWMEGPGRDAYREAAAETAALRADFPALRGPGLDPTRLTLLSPDGFALHGALEGAGVAPEMADRGHVVCILTGADRPEDWARLRGALEAHGGLLGPGVEWDEPPEPEAVLTPREALLRPRKRVPLRDAAGRVAAGWVAPYPPGVPVAAPGEVISEKVLAYLRELGYNVDTSVDVCL